ncbi:alpha/beta fold hydrolase [Streptomyces sp. NPDC057617]|uniref:alpha/beta fold hydrolase n=1 Tax=Streptomyces sp. NPDC057617 TaxID=3346184 RepID=UPI0036A71884
MVRRIDVTGADGVRLAAWEFTDPPGRRAEPEAERGGGARDGRDGRDNGEQAGERGRIPGVPERTAGVPEPTPGVLLLHGLMGRASHWAPTGRWLAERHRTVALDQRGHGFSEKPADGPYTREAYVADAETVIEQLGLGPVTLIGHAMGALTGWQLAARRPDLVRALVISDMRASALGAKSQQQWARWFDAWPVPFATLDDARKWFAEDDPWADRPAPSRGEFFAEVMTERADGWHPVFSRDQMLTSRATWVLDAHWEELAQVQCPALVVRGLDGDLGRAEAQEMVRVLPRGRYAEVTDAGHLIHYDRPEAYREAIEPFLDGVLTG